MTDSMLSPLVIDMVLGRSRPRLHPSQQSEQHGSSPTSDASPFPVSPAIETANMSDEPAYQYASPRVPQEPAPHTNHGNAGRRIQQNERHTSQQPAHQLRALPDAALQGWKDWPNLRLRVRGLSPGFPICDIYDSLAPHGSIGRIEIDTTTSSSSTSAFIIFFPPPRKPFWECGSIYIGRRSYHVSVVPHTYPTVAGPLKTRHPAFLNVYAKSFTFGVMTNHTIMMQMQAIHYKTRNDIVLQLNMRRQELDIRFPYPADGRPEDRPRGRFRVNLSDLREVQSINLNEGNKIALVFTLPTPPEFFRQQEAEDIQFESNIPVWTEWSSWSRQTELVKEGRDHTNDPLRLRSEHAVIDFGRWLTYRFVVSKRSTAYARLLRTFTDFNIRINNLVEQQFTVIPRHDATIWNHLELSSTHGTTKKSSYDLFAGMAEMRSGLSHLPFPVLWQLMVCISRGYLNEFNMTQEFLQKLNDIGEVKAQGILEWIADRKLRYHDPMRIFGEARTSSPPKRVPVHCSVVYSCNITPTTIIFSSPVVEISNRVARKFPMYQDRFLRVRLTEENSSRIYSRADSANDKVFDRVRRFLKHGLILGDRHYEFLAFGNSQFREHGLYCFASIKGLAEIPDMTAADIRAQLGDFSHIRTPAKYCARLGQNLSTTRTFGTSVTVEHDKDIIHNDYMFSDGVGKMSLFVARMIGMEFGRTTDDPPSVVQFRLGGSKGILAISPETSGRKVVLRDSQTKFQSTSQGLEIIRISQFATASLNRQIITVLSSLGVPDSVFTGLFRTLLADLELAMTDKDIASRLLKQNFNQTAMVRMIQDGFMESQDPFMMSILRLWRSWTIKGLKEKAKIFIPKSAYLFGSVDEYAVLKGHSDSIKDNTDLPEVFVQVNIDGQYTILEGVCMIARNPSLHPGDIRIVRAVNKPELHHMEDVLVMPQIGDRDLGSMCSGGDLDGDDYLVVWEESLFPPMEQWNQPAMDHEADTSKDKKVDCDVTVDDIIQFFIQYMRNDQLPTIALAHLCWSDQYGVKDPRCLELSKLHSKAVDYPKSGNAAEMPRKLRPGKWPHFMEKKFMPENQIYHSESVLGQLYDMIERIDFVPVWDNPFDARILAAFSDVISETMLLKVADLKAQYDTAIQRIMAQLGIATEFEVVTTFAMSFNREKKDYTLTEELGNIIQAHQTRMREACIDAAGGRTYNEFGPFLVAMYRTTEQQVKEALAAGVEAGDMPLISFPWIFGEELGLIARGEYRGDDIIHVISTIDHKKPKRKPVKIDDDTAVDLSRSFGDLPVVKAPSSVEKPFTKSQVGKQLPRLATGQVIPGSRLGTPALSPAMPSSGPDTPASELRTGSEGAGAFTPASSLDGFDDANVDEVEDSGVQNVVGRLAAMMDDMAEDSA